MVSVSSTGLTGATQAVTFVNGPDSLVFINPPPSQLRAGVCFPMSYQARRGGMAMAVGSNANVSFSSTPISGARFYSDAACTTATAAQVLGAGTTTDTVFVRVLAGGMGTLQAQVNFMTPATAMVDALPMVRRGTCTFDPQEWTLIDGGPDAGLIDGGPVPQLTRTCGLTPAPIARDATMLFFQGISAGPYADAMVRCRLPSSGGVACSRRSGVARATVHWQVVEVPTGLRVVQASSTSCATTITLGTTVDPAKTFLLKAVANSSGQYDDEDAPVFTLTSPTTVSASIGGCQGYDLQAIEWDGVSVARGTLDGGLLAGVAQTTLLGLTPASLQRATLTQTGTSSNAALNTCSLLARASMPGPSELRFSRALGDAGCAVDVAQSVAWERIDFGPRATVQERTLTFAAGQAQLTSTITAVDPTRTFVVSSGQSANGQGTGETDEPVASRPGQAAFTLELTDATTVTAQRAVSSAAAAITFYVVQVE